MHTTKTNGRILKHKESGYWANTLTPLTGKIKAVDFIGFDVETFGDENEFYSGGLYYYRGEKRKEVFKYFTDKEELIKELFRPKNASKYVTATNLGFDIASLFFNTKYWNDLQFIYRGSDLLLVKYRVPKTTKYIKIIDSFNFVKFSVAKMGEILKTGKLEKPSFWENKGGDYNAIKPRTLKEEEELKIYNKQDCKITCDFMYLIQKGLNKNGGNFKITSASSSMDCFRRTYLKRNITKEQFFFKGIQDKIFKTYYGGRTETFKRGYFLDELSYYDINSLYPSVMRDGVYPLPNSIEMCSIGTTKQIYKYEGFSKCAVYLKKGTLKRPLLPHKVNDKLCFPEGHFTGWWTHPELRKAIDLGYEVKVLEQWIYKETFNPFKDYINNIYNTRLEHLAEDNPLEKIDKLLMNSLYGKFAQRQKSTTIIKNLDYMTKEERNKFSLSKEEGWTIKEDHIIMTKTSSFDGSFVFPIFASYVTSYARLKLYEFLEKYDVVYCDTDSIVIRGEIDHKYISRELGFMKLEFKPQKAVFVKPKFYALEEDVKIKGLNKANINDFNALLLGFSVPKMKFSKIRESVRRGILPNTKINVDKSLSLEDNKREWKGTFNTLTSHPVLLNQESKPLFIREISEDVKNDTRIYKRERANTEI